MPNIQLSPDSYVPNKAKHNFCFMLKTFKNDILAVRRLVRSFNLYNRNNIALYIVCPEPDTSLFVESFGSMPNIVILNDEVFSQHLVDMPLMMPGGIEPTRIGYVNQMLIKLCFWELCLTQNYFCLDSDGEFIRPFFVNDFMYDEITPYTTLVEDNLLKVDPYYFNFCGWNNREKTIRNLQKVIGYNSRVVLTAHGFMTMNASVLFDLRVQFMLPNKYTYANLLEIGGYEFSWHTQWQLMRQCIPLHVREPFFLCFHHEKQLKNFKAQGITRSDIARGYVGIVVNSNFQGGRGEKHLLSYETYSNFLSLDPTFKEIFSYLCNIMIPKKFPRLSRWLPSWLKRVVKSIVS